MVVNFGAHPTVYTQRGPWDVSRDVPGELCDLLELTFRQPVAYIQGACGDVNFHREFIAPERCREPALRLMAAALESLKQAKPMEDPVVAAASETALLPTRRWTRE